MVGICCHFFIYIEGKEIKALNRKDTINYKYDNYTVALHMIDVLMENGQINQATHSNIMRNAKKRLTTKRY